LSKVKAAKSSFQLAKIYPMAVTSLSFDSLLATLNRTIDQMKDPRQPSNATSYSLQDALLGAFSAFFMQSNSFLEYQRQLHSRHGRDNAQSLFGLEKIPSVEQIRNILDLLAADGLSAVFTLVYRCLEQQGYLRQFEVVGEHLLVALDGTEYYSSQKVGCPCCSTRTARNGAVTYSHKASLPAIVAPDQSAVISFAPCLYPPSRWS
jgi:hypothetical protein